MRIGVNTRLLLDERIEGIGRFSYEILKRLAKEHPEHTFVFFFDRRYNVKFVFANNVIPVVLFPQARHPFLWYLFFEFAVPIALKKHKVDVFLSLDGWLSLTTKTCTIQVLHDLHYEVCPQYLPFFTRKYFQHFFPLFAKRANYLITVSEFCKKSIANLYDINEDKIAVAHNSSRELFQPVSLQQISDVKLKYTNNEDYFIVVGPIHPRKNTYNIILAFIEFKKRSKSKCKLLIAGKFMYRFFGKKNGSKLKEFRNDIVFLGYLKDEELHRVLASSLCLVYASNYEGFGIPIIEAMGCGVPVITSNTSSMPEVAGDSSILVEPSNIGDIAEAMCVIYNEPGTRQKLIEKGYKNVRRFSWDDSAKIVWKTILNCHNLHRQNQ